MSHFNLNQKFEELVKTMLQAEQVLNTKKNENNNNNNDNSNKIKTEDEWAKSPNSFQDNMSVKKEKMGKKYTTTRI